MTRELVARLTKIPGFVKLDQWSDRSFWAEFVTETRVPGLARPVNRAVIVPLKVVSTTEAAVAEVVRRLDQ